MGVRDRRAPGLRRPPRGGPLRALGLVALYGAAAVVSAWPGLGSFRSGYLAGGASGFGEAAVGDHGQVVYRLWLVGHQLAGGAAPWRDPYSFQPLVKPQLALGGWPFGFPFWPLEAAFGPVVAWNVLQLAVVVLAGLATYGWLRALGLRPLAAAAGGLAFALAPYRLAQSADHVLGWIAVFLPFTLLGVERARIAATRRAAHGWGALAAGSLVTFVVSGQLNLALGGIALALAYAAVRFERVSFLWTAGGVAGATALGIGLRLTVIADSELAGRRTLADVATYSAETTDFLDRWHRAPSEELVYLGWLTPVLALAGLWLLARRDRRLAAVLGVAVLVPVLLAFGTNLPLYAPLRAIFPPFRNVRVPGRLMPVADLALAALAAVAVAEIAVHLAGRRLLAGGAVVLALVAADLTIMPWAATPGDPGNAAYAALDRRPEDRLLELPLFEPGRNEGAVYNLYTLQAPIERPGGYSTLAPAAPFTFYWDYGRLSCGVWLPGDAQELDRVGIRHIAFHHGLYRAGVPGAWFAWRGLAEHGWRPVAEGGAVTLFAPGAGTRPPSDLGEPAVYAPYFCRGWNAVRRTIEPEAPLWVFGEGRLRLELTSARRTDGSLWVDGARDQAFTVDRRGVVTTRLTGRRWHPLVVQIPDLFQAGPPYGVRLVRITFPWE